MEVTETTTAFLVEFSSEETDYYIYRGDITSQAGAQLILIEQHATHPENTPIHLREEEQTDQVALVVSTYNPETGAGYSTIWYHSTPDYKGVLPSEGVYFYPSGMALALWQWDINGNPIYAEELYDDPGFILIKSMKDFYSGTSTSHFFE